MSFLWIPAFLAIFDFPLVKGNRANCFTETEQRCSHRIHGAKKLFGDADPIGKTIKHYDGDTVYIHGDRHYERCS